MPFWFGTVICKNVISKKLAQINPNPIGKLMQVTNTESATLTSVKTLLAGAIDYAGLFPPAALSMSEAVINYATYRNSNYNWMLGRFVVTGRRDWMNFTKMHAILFPAMPRTHGG